MTGTHARLLAAVVRGDERDADVLNDYDAERGLRPSARWAPADEFGGMACDYVLLYRGFPVAAHDSVPARALELAAGGLWCAKPPETDDVATVRLLRPLATQPTHVALIRPDPKSTTDRVTVETFLARAGRGATRSDGLEGAEMQSYYQEELAGFELAVYLGLSFAELRARVESGLMPWEQRVWRSSYVDDARLTVRRFANAAARAARWREVVALFG